MKVLFSILLLSLSLSALAGVTYPINHYKYISEWDFNDEVESSDKHVVIVFSNNQCLERTIIDRSCFLFEKMLDYYIPSFNQEFVKVVGVNTFNENFGLVTRFLINKIPTVIIYKDGQILERIENNSQKPDVTEGRLGWQYEMIKKVVDIVYKIR